MAYHHDLAKLAFLTTFLLMGCHSATPPAKNQPATRGIELSVLGDVELLRHNHALNVRELYARGMTNKGLVLERWTQLHVLDLALCRDVTDEGLEAIGLLRDLRSLNLIETAITDKTIARLSALPVLEELYIGGTSVTGRGLGNLIHLKNLAMTNAHEIKDASLGDLHKLSQLRCLMLNGTEVSNEGLAEVAKITTLRDLRLAFTGVSDPGLAHVAKLKALLRLSLDSSEITDEGITALLDLSNLEELALGYTAVSDRGTLRLARLPKLRRLWIAGTRVSPEGFEKLRKAIPQVELNPSRPLGDIPAPLDERIMGFAKSGPLNF